MRNLDRPPPLHRNKRYKKLARYDNTASSSSDDEIDNKTYNLRRLGLGDRSQTQSKNVIKTPSNSRLLRKRLVEESKSDDLQDDRSSSPMKRPKKMLDSIHELSRASSSIDSCLVNTFDLSKPYSELKYLESFGSIRTIRRAKHPNINKVPTTKSITATPLISPESQNRWDRKTKLKISYRTGLVKKDDIQFALIIYEPLTIVTRRNLLEEFEKAALEEEKQKYAATSNVNSRLSPVKPFKSPKNTMMLKTPTIRSKPKNDKVTPLRRLRF